MKLPFGSKSKTMMALALPAGLVLMASLLVAPTPTAMAQTTAVATPSGNGYWLVATDGGIFAYGDAGFFGSLGDKTLNKPITGMVPTPTGLGYWLVASDGGIFAFGDADFFGSAGGIALDKPIVGMANSGQEAGFSAAGAKGATGPPGSSGPPGLAGRDATYVGPDWSIIDRNVLGGGDSYLRAGPGFALSGSLGQGSLGIRTGSPADKSAFGNSTLLAGDRVKDLTEVSFSVFTTKENSTASTANPTNHLANLPNLTFEIDPNRTGFPSNYSSLVFIPAALTIAQSNSTWTNIDATTDAAGIWALTGGTHTACRHNTADACTFTQMQDYLDEGGANDEDALITFSVAFSKGRDNAFSGAVDRLVINNQMFDFEPFGVTMTAVL